MGCGAEVFVWLHGLAAVLAAASVAPLAVDADALAAAVPAVAPLTSVHADAAAAAALLALATNPLVHADAASEGRTPLVLPWIPSTVCAFDIVCIDEC